MDILQQLLQLEEAGWRSLCDGSGSDFYGNLMTDEGLMILADGSTMTRRQVAEALRHAPPWVSFSIADPHLVPIGVDTASLVYVGTALRGDGTAFKAAMCSTYVKTVSGWRLALYQQTPTHNG